MASPPAETLIGGGKKCQGMTSVVPNTPREIVGFSCEVSIRCLHQAVVLKGLGFSRANEFNTNGSGL
jgi:hypothetical protein